MSKNNNSIASNTCFDLHKALQYVQENKLHGKFYNLITKMYVSAYVSISFKNSTIPAETFGALEFLAALAKEVPNWWNDDGAPNSDQSKVEQVHAQLQELQNKVEFLLAFTSPQQQQQLQVVEDQVMTDLPATTVVPTNSTAAVQKKQQQQQKYEKPLPSQTELTAQVIPNENPFKPCKVVLTWNSIAPSTYWNYYVYKNRAKCAKIDSNMTSFEEIVETSQQIEYCVGTHYNTTSNYCSVKASMHYHLLMILVAVINPSDCIVRTSVLRPVQNEPFAVIISHKDGLSSKCVPFITVSCKTNVAIGTPMVNEQNHIVFPVKASIHGNATFQVTVAHASFVTSAMVEPTFDIQKVTVEEVPQQSTVGTKLLVKVLYGQEDFDLEGQLVAKLVTSKGTSITKLARASPQKYFCTVPLEVAESCELVIEYGNTKIKSIPLQIVPQNAEYLVQSFATVTSMTTHVPNPTTSGNITISLVNYNPTASKILNLLKAKGIKLVEYSQSHACDAYIFFCYPNLSPNFEDYRNVMTPVCAHGKPVVMVMVYDTQANPECKKYFTSLPKHDFPTRRVIFWEQHVSGLQDVERLLQML